jgi:hypothetical protein
LAIKNIILFYSYFDRQTGPLDPDLRQDLDFLVENAQKILAATATITLQNRWYTYLHFDLKGVSPPWSSLESCK